MAKKKKEIRTKASSKFDPDPTLVGKRDEVSQPPPAIPVKPSKPISPKQAKPAKPDPVPKTSELASPTEKKPTAKKELTPKSKDQAVTSEYKEDRNTFWAGPEYPIKTNEGTGHRICVRVITNGSNFKETCTMLGLKSFDPTDTNKAKKLLETMCFPQTEVFDRMMKDQEWKTHAREKMKQLKERAAKGDEKAKKTLESDRVSGDEWIGNIEEIVAVNISSYSEAWDRTHGKPVKFNRNCRKLTSAGVVIRRFTDPTNKTKYIMMFPEKYLLVVEKAILTVFGVDESKSRPSRGKPSGK